MTIEYLVMAVDYFCYLFQNPDLWKLNERGYSVRALEIAILGVTIGWLVDRLSQAIIMRQRQIQAAQTAALYPKPNND